MIWELSHFVFFFFPIELLSIFNTNYEIRVSHSRYASHRIQIRIANKTGIFLIVSIFFNVTIFKKIFNFVLFFSFLFEYFLTFFLFYFNLHYMLYFSIYLYTFYISITCILFFHSTLIKRNVNFLYIFNYIFLLFYIYIFNEIINYNEKQYCSLLKIKICV